MAEEGVVVVVGETVAVESVGWPVMRAGQTADPYLVAYYASTVVQTAVRNSS